jgi:hypothetical protein
MNYFKIFRDVGIMENELNFFKHCYFDIEQNCRKSSETLFEMIDAVYMTNDFKNDLSDFIMDLKSLYTEVGVKLGCLVIDRHFAKEIHLTFCDTDKREMRKFLSLDGYLDNIFNRLGDILVKPDIEDLFSGMRKKISLLQYDLVVKYSVPEAAINYVLNSAEFKKLRYFLIKTGFKYGVFLCIAINTLKQLSEESGKKLSSGRLPHKVDLIK